MNSNEFAEAGAGLECHFTYCPPAGNNLKQGDILNKTSGIEEILRDAHPHYLREDYTHFLVLTQTCDLVRRDGKNSCKTRYITLAAVRPLALVLKREIRGYQDELTGAANVCSMSHRTKLMQFLERLLNNNEPEYFYLHEDAALGFPESSCAFLRLSIGLRTSDHYKVCLDARVASLMKSFQAKLGWLIGNMYSRVGTEDWVPEHDTSKDFQKRIAYLLDSTCPWVDDEKLKVAKRTASAELLTKPLEEIRAHITNAEVTPKRDRVINSVLQVLREFNVVNDDALEKQIRTRLTNHPEIASVLPKK
jgi:hypothetical protein